MPALDSLQSIMQRQVNAMQDAMQAPLRVLGKALTLRAQAVVDDWANKPQFEYEVFERRGRIVMQWRPKGKHKAIWYYVDLGTKPHVIVPVEAPRLAFQTGYVPKTAPIARANDGPGKAFGAWRTADIVFHPGNKARQFAQTALDELGPEWVEKENRAIREAIRS